MIRFFRNIRKQLAAENKPAKYMRYAVGEVLLIVLGIFMALQLQNWNERRKERNAFEFGIAQMYRQMLYSYFDLSTTEEKLKIQLAYMDSITNHPELLAPQKLPGIIQMFDYSGITRNRGLTDILEPYLKLNPNDETQSDLAIAFRDMLDIRENVHDWYDSTEYPNSDQFEPTILFYEYLQKEGVSLRFLETVQSYFDFINPAEKDYYSEEEIKRVTEIIRTQKFLADVKTTKRFKEELLASVPQSRRGSELFLNFLKENYPESEYKIQDMEIIGTGTEIGNWVTGIKMNQVENSMFQLETVLQDGEVKFRTDGNWTFDWGGSAISTSILVFKGSDIPVEKGRVLITLNIEENTYAIVPLD